jgi:hypothetical protein
LLGGLALAEEEEGQEGYREYGDNRDLHERVVSFRLAVVQGIV